MKFPGTKKFVGQVKPLNKGRLKWQFELRVAVELLEEDGMLQKVIHGRAARIAKQQTELGEWPASEQVVVWYAEMDEDTYMPINEVDWHPLVLS